MYRAGLLIILFYKRGTQESERLSRLAVVTQLVNGQVRIRAQLSLVPETGLFLSVSVLRRGPGGRSSVIGQREVEDVVHTQKDPTEEREQPWLIHGRKEWGAPGMAWP